MKIAYSSQMRELDRITIEETGIPEVVLMENAGKEVVSIMTDYLPELILKTTVILCGPGNNGGDGFVIARHLFNQGCDCTVFLIGTCEQLKGAAKINADIARKIGVCITEVISAEKLPVVINAVRDADVIVDALFGTGLHRQLTGLFAQLIQYVNDSDAYVVSVDLPSGMCADFCTPIGPTIRADLTITFGLPKPSLLLYPAAELAGQVVVADISIPQSNVERLEISGEILTPYHFPALFTSRAPNVHKGQFGHLLILAGSPGKTGAAILAATAAARSGAGLVTLAVPESLNPIIETVLTEVMSLPLPGSSSWFSPDHVGPVIDALSGKSALLIGPGIGIRDETSTFLRMVMQEIDIPIVLDADALNIMSMSPGPWFRKAVPRILTPHPGEFRRLTDIDRNALERDPVDPVCDYANSTSSIVVYKSARSVIAFPDGSHYVNITGNPGLASGGSGDVLAGMIAGLTAKGFDPQQAALAGVFWHGLTGDVTAFFEGEEEMLAGDMFDHMGIARRIIIENPDIFNGVHTPYLNLDSLLNPHL
ncbi:NAD(P)H-hydrate dehydratase [bacterium]|nr:NAD(P)H-hydrate dehydratase [candidate division CSSED10-310 bacterium]